MSRSYEFIATAFWNSLIPAPLGTKSEDLVLGRVVGGAQSGQELRLSGLERREHVAVLGKTGSGKSSLLLSLCAQDVAAGRGFVFFDLHGDSMRHITAFISQLERCTGDDLAARLVVVNPSDREWAVGLNVLDAKDEHDRFVRVAEIVRVLKRRWQLDTLGARTEELVRNGLLILMDSGLTLLELGPLLISDRFREQALRRARPGEAKQYFVHRYNRVSDAMRVLMREAVLNKLSAYTADPHFRHTLGQQSSMSWERVLRDGLWVVVCLEKGRLGDEAATIGSLFLSGLKNALFARSSSELFTLYCDELHNLVAYDDALESLFAEARKFGVSVCSANQYLDQYPAVMQAALLAAGTHAFFRLSAPDAERIAHMHGGAGRLADTLRGLAQRHYLLRRGPDLLRNLVAPDVRVSAHADSDLYERSMQRWAKRRADVEDEIVARSSGFGLGRKDLSDWE